MYKKILAGVHKKYPIIIGKKSICKEFLPKAVKNNSKVMIITDFGVPKAVSYTHLTLPTMDSV